MGAMNDFLTMVHENFVPSSGREQGNNSHNCQSHLQEQQPRRRPRRLNCEKAKLLNGLGPVEARSEGKRSADDDLREANWDLIPAPPITPPAAFRPNPESSYRRVSALRKGKKRVGVFTSNCCLGRYWN